MMRCDATLFMLSIAFHFSLCLVSFNVLNGVLQLQLMKSAYK
jgi:hypothetical protein